MDTSKHFETLAIYTMHAGSKTQLLQMANYHLSCGVEKIYVYLDRYDRSEYESLPQHSKVEWILCDDKYWNDCFYTQPNVEAKQVFGFKQACRTAFREGLEYIAFVDSDELLYLNRPFKEIVKDYPDNSDVFVLKTKEMRYSLKNLMDTPFSADIAISHRTDGVNWSDSYGYVASLASNGFFAHTSGKSIYRLPLVFDEITVHGPDIQDISANKGNFSIQTIDSLTGSLLHFDWATFDIWKKKWLNRINGWTNATGLSDKRLLQMKVIQRALERPIQYQQGLYKEFFVLDDNPLISLSDRSLAEKIKLKDEVFDSPFSLLHNIQDELKNNQLVTDVVDSYQFALVTDTNFLRPTIATIMSIIRYIDKEKPLKFFVLTDGVNEDLILELEKIRFVFDSMTSLEIHDITFKLDRDVGIGDIKRATFGRIYLPDYVSRGRLIYLDSDVLATENISELFSQDFGGAGLAGVPDSAAYRIKYNPKAVTDSQTRRLVSIVKGESNVLSYLNGGVLVMDYDSPDFFKQALLAKALVLFDLKSLVQRDQDALNIAFRGAKYILPPEYNFMTQFFTSSRSSSSKLCDLALSGGNAKLIHFSGKNKPWMEEDDTFYNGLYIRLVKELEEHFRFSCGLFFSDSRPFFYCSKNKKIDYFEKIFFRRGLKNKKVNISRPKNIESTIKNSSDDDYIYVFRNIEVLDINKGKIIFSFSGSTDLLEKLSIIIFSNQSITAYASLRDSTKISCLGHEKYHYSVPFTKITNDTESHDVVFTLNHSNVLEGILGSKSYGTEFPGFVKRGIYNVRFMSYREKLISDTSSYPSIDGVIERIDSGVLFGWVVDNKLSTMELDISIYIDGILVKKQDAFKSRDDLDRTGIEGKVFVCRLPEISGILEVYITGTNILLRRSPVTFEATSSYQWNNESNSWFGV